MKNEGEEHIIVEEDMPETDPKMVEKETTYTEIFLDSMIFACLFFVGLFIIYMIVLAAACFVLAAACNWLIRTIILAFF